MDPNAALAELRAALTTAREAADGDSNDAEIEAWQEVGDAVEALDEWLSKGGFLPTAWQPENSGDRNRRLNAEVANAAHADGRHVGANREDRKVWADLGCIACQATL